MSVVVPQNPQDIAYLANKSGLATFSGPWFDASLCKSVSFQLAWSAVAATNGTLSIEGTNDSAEAAADIVTIAVAAAGIGASVEFQGTWPTVGAIAANALVTLRDPPHFVRVSYTRVAGGGANQFQGFAFGRSL